MGSVNVRVGTQAAGHPTSEVSSREPGSTQVYKHPLGTVAFDDVGNEYVYVEYGEQVYGGVWVGITAAYTAVAVLTATFKGPVGIAMGAGASDHAGWVLVRGTHSAAQLAGGDSAATSSYHLVVASSVSSPAAGADAIAGTTPTSDGGNTIGARVRIHNAWLTGAASSATTSATSAVGVTQPVRLNYPYVTGYTEEPTS